MNDTETMIQEANPSDTSVYTVENTTEDSILNCLLYTETGTASKSPINLNEENLKIYRDVSNWKFEDPHYSCIVKVTNSSGLELDFGPSYVSINDNDFTNDVLTIPHGVSRIKVHKDYWIGGIAPDLLPEILQNDDPLFPYNVKYLIEGYNYASNTNEEDKIYRGVDLYAAREMQRVSVFDMLNNVASNDYSKYAIDLSLPGTGSSNDNTVKKVFLTKKPTGSTEKFRIEFNLINALRTYVKFKAELETSNSKVTPSLDGYQIKLG